jgi:diaminopimelate decarboxylase
VTPDLEPVVWPASAVRGDDGVLSLGGVDVRTLADEFGTPAYVLDEDDFRARCRAWRTAFPDGDVYYAGKAFLTTALARWVEQEGLSLDVCTGGELAVALKAGFPPSGCCSTATTRASPSSSGASARASGASSSTAPTSWSGSPRSPSATASGSGSTSG